MQPNDQQPVPTPEQPPVQPPAAPQPIAQPAPSYPDTAPQPPAQTPLATPSVSPVQPVTYAQPPVQPLQPIEQPAVEAQPAPQPPVQPQPVAPAQAPVPSQIQPQEPIAPLQPAEQPMPAQPTPLPQVEPVRWQAAEYIQHSKSPIWYVGFVTVVVLLMVAAILLMQAWTFAVLVPVMAVALMAYSHRPPRQLNYVLSAKGIYINEQLHPLGEFKSFGVVQEPDHNTLVLVPIKRFRPGLTVFFPSDVGEAIVDLLGGFMPMREEKPDAFDKIVRKLRI